MGARMSKETRREVMNALRQDYALAPTRAGKGAILDRLVGTLGVRRKYAIAAMAKSVSAPQRASLARQRYGPQARAAVVALWESSGRLCSRQLVPFLPHLVEALERHGQLSISPETRCLVLKMGHATVDRILAAVRYGSEQAARTKRHRAADLRRQIPVRTFSDWAQAMPGECSADLVAHCGQVLEGSFLWSLVVTDVVTGWTEVFGLLVRDANAVIVGLGRLKKGSPAGITALHTDNGSEFIKGVDGPRSSAPGSRKYATATRITPLPGETTEKLVVTKQVIQGGGTVRVKESTFRLGTATTSVADPVAASLNAYSAMYVSRSIEMIMRIRP